MTSSIIRIPEPFAVPVAAKPMFAECEALTATMALADSFATSQAKRRDAILALALRTVYKLPEGKK